MTLSRKNWESDYQIHEFDCLKTILTTVQIFSSDLHLVW